MAAEAKNFNVILNPRKEGRTGCFLSGSTLVIAYAPDEDHHKAIRQSIARRDFTPSFGLPDEPRTIEFPYKWPSRVVHGRVQVRVSNAEDLWAATVTKVGHSYRMAPTTYSGNSKNIAIGKLRVGVLEHIDRMLSVHAPHKIADEHVFELPWVTQ